MTAAVTPQRACPQELAHNASRIRTSTEHLLAEQVCSSSADDVSMPYASAWLGSTRNKTPLMLFKFSLRESSRKRGIRRVALFVKKNVAEFLYKYRYMPLCPPPPFTPGELSHTMNRPRCGTVFPASSIHVFWPPRVHAYLHPTHDEERKEALLCSAQMHALRKRRP